MAEQALDNQPKSNINQPLPPIPNPTQVQAIPLDVPQGLERLTTIDIVFVKQRVEILEVALGCEINNMYDVVNSIGEFLFEAKETTTCCAMKCCSPKRPFNIEIKDMYGEQIIHFDRPRACGFVCFPCCLQTLNVSAPPGRVLGSVQQNWSCFPSYVVRDQAGKVLFRIKGPFVHSSCLKNVAFKVLSADSNTEVGRIAKHWSGFLRETYAGVDNFGISFPVDLDVRNKALLIGACFLIGFMYFEQDPSPETIAAINDTSHRISQYANMDLPQSAVVIVNLDFIAFSREDNPELVLKESISGKSPN